jgi:hypothetical protein
MEEVVRPGPFSGESVKEGDGLERWNPGAALWSIGYGKGICFAEHSRDRPAQDNLRGQLCAGR